MRSCWGRRRSDPWMVFSKSSAWTIVYMMTSLSLLGQLTLSLPINIHIGALLDSEAHRLFLARTVQALNPLHSSFNVPRILSVEDTDLSQESAANSLLFNASSIIAHSSPIRTALLMCRHLLNHPVYAILISQPASGYHLSAAAASYTAGFYRIPILSINNRESLFSDKNVHKSFLRTVSPYFHQVDGWVKLLAHFGWKSVIVISSSNQDGRMLFNRLQSQVEKQEIAIEKSIEFEEGVVDVDKDLANVKSALHGRVFLLFAQTKDAAYIFQAAHSQGLLTAGNVWILTEQALDAANCPIGALGLKLLHYDNTEDHITDAVQIIAQASLVSYAEKHLSVPPNNCNDTSFTWTDGPYFFQNVLKQSLPHGRTGQLSFDDTGDRKVAEYHIVNVQAEKQLVVLGSITVDSHDSSNTRITLDRRKRIVWPGTDSPDVPKGFTMATHLKVYTVAEAPFTLVEQGLNASMCEEVFRGVVCHPHGRSLLNPATVRDPVQCCWGYNIDLLKSFSISVEFSFDLFLAPATQHFPPEKKNSTDEPAWSGVLGELVHGDGDMAVAALTIMPEHAKHVDFSKPFKYLGITILEKKQPRASTLNSFFQPFTSDLWVLAMVCLHVVALAMYLLDRFSPFSRYVLPGGDEPEEDALNLSSAMWFAWGVLLNSGIGEGTPRSFGGRVLGMVWAGFAMIMVASYTANLAAFLVLDRPQSSLTGVNDARLRNPSENFTFATVSGSAVDFYFKRQVELATMYRIMEKQNYNDSAQAIAAVKSGELQAFIWDSARLEYEAAKDKDCELVTAGELFGRSGYGVALRKGSPWTSKVTLAILGFHENGFMESLDNRYIYMRNNTQCLPEENAPATLGLQNMAGVFILVGIGIAGGIILIIIEISYKRSQVAKQRQARVTRMAFDRWRRTIDVSGIIVYDAYVKTGTWFLGIIILIRKRNRRKVDPSVGWVD
ncbi:hypothetical protein RvY_17412-2 [Ramazzottius varieornatus]|uniref:Ionotropic glutamate receptor C-terminal domain-containing protein n=1 Tax=Ramazzottius varieornatus TaxID=947166 RepID=A0A1D1W7W7_RAMVA|nr:hypothetical protein RvY_17412-2 [Ramazzottius varieornatus]